MGKIPRGGLTLEDVRLKVPRGTGGSSGCSAELVGLLACLDVHGGDQVKCSEARMALSNCMHAKMAGGGGGRKHKAPINYHLKTVSAHASQRAPACKRRCAAMHI